MFKCNDLKTLSELMKTCTHYKPETTIASLGPQVIKPILTSTT